MTTCYINGNYKDILKSKVSITDRGFQFSDDVYEVIAVYKNKFVDIVFVIIAVIKGNIKANAKLFFVLKY